MIYFACTLNRFVLAGYLIKFSHMFRIYLSTGLMFLGHISVATSTYFNTGNNKPMIGFAIALLASVFHGLAYSIGEVTLLGYLKSFGPELMKAYGAGTGISQVFGQLLYQLLRNVSEVSIPKASA